MLVIMNAGLLKTYLFFTKKPYLQRVGETSVLEFDLKIFKLSVIKYDNYNFFKTIFLGYRNHFLKVNFKKV